MRLLMRPKFRRDRPLFNRLLPVALTVLALVVVVTGVGQVQTTTPIEARGVVRLRARVKSGETTKGLSRKRFFLIRGTLEQNKTLIQTTEQASVVTRDCYYRSIGASEALIKWLQESDCESVYCREIEVADLDGTNAVPEFQRALAVGEQEFATRDLARKWLTVNLAENIREGFYKARQRELQKLTSRQKNVGARVLSVRRIQRDGLLYD